MSLVERLDYSGIKKVTETPQGFLKIPASLTRVGVLNYKVDSGIYRELRLPEEVFKADSLASLRQAPVTDLHPSSFVTPANVRTLQRGMVSDDVRADENHVSAHVIVQDAELIEAIKKGDRCELSPGYTCNVEHAPGEWQGQKYDGIQRDIVYNHLAVGPRGWARSGPSVRLHTDDDLREKIDEGIRSGRFSLQELAKHLRLEPQELIYRLDGWESAPPDFTTAIAAFVKPPGRKQMTKIKIDGHEVELAESEAAAVSTAVSKLQAKADSATARADALQAKLDHETSPEVVNARVAARTALESKARAILGAEAKFDGKTDRDVRIETIKKAVLTFDAKDQSDDYVAAYFDSVSVQIVSKVDSFKVVETEKEDSTLPVDDVDAARKRAQEKSANAWQTPTAYSKP